jgi:hypothetical protein
VPSPYILKNKNAYRKMAGHSRGVLRWGNARHRFKHAATRLSLQGRRRSMPRFCAAGAGRMKHASAPWVKVWLATPTRRENRRFLSHLEGSRSLIL